MTWLCIYWLLVGIEPYSQNSYSVKYITANDDLRSTFVNAWFCLLLILQNPVEVKNLGDCWCFLLLLDQATENTQDFHNAVENPVLILHRLKDSCLQEHLHEDTTE